MANIQLELPLSFDAARRDLTWFFKRAKSRGLRTMRQFAEAEIVLPDGPFQGRRFKCDRQPYTRLWFDAVDSGNWTRFVATGPVQSGKTLSCFVAPLLYHLFEIGETVICGLPTLEMAADKWREDILPVIECSGFRHLLPRQGGGSRGGKVDSIKFRNGATLKFMSGGGGDKKRAGFTARVVVITETDGMDEAGGTSREADKITQLEARTRAYGERRRVYMECTVSTEEGRTWREYQAGTQSKILVRCPHCRRLSSPERQDLGGWESAATSIEAKQLATFACPECGEAWSAEDRAKANREAVLLHRGQEATEDSQIVGVPTPTDTLGFRWSAVNNLFVTAGDVGQSEWRAVRSSNEDNAEKELCQFIYAVPHKPESWQTTSLGAEMIISRTVAIPRGVVPADCDYLTIGIDVGKWLIHWVATAWRNGASGHVVEYGRFDLATDNIGVERAVLAGLREFRDTVEHGWPQNEKMMQPNLVFIDAGYQGESVLAFCGESGLRYMPTLGRGVGQQYAKSYTRPKTTGAMVKIIGEEFHVSTVADNAKQLRVETNADYWKSWLHQRLVTPIGTAGAMTLHAAQRNDHLSFAKHLTAERQVQEFIAGKGAVTKWEPIHRNNHFLDAAYLACVAASACGVSLVSANVVTEIEPQFISTGERRPDGRPWIN